MKPAKPSNAMAGAINKGKSKPATSGLGRTTAAAKANPAAAGGLARAAQGGTGRNVPVPGNPFKEERPKRAVRKFEKPSIGTARGRR